LQPKVLVMENVKSFGHDSVIDRNRQESASERRDHVCFPAHRASPCSFPRTAYTMSGTPSIWQWRLGISTAVIELLPWRRSYMKNRFFELQVCHAPRKRASMK
jgi:hypothetical protein